MTYIEFLKRTRKLGATKILPLPKDFIAFFTDELTTVAVKDPEMIEFLKSGGLGERKIGKYIIVEDEIAKQNEDKTLKELAIEKVTRRLAKNNAEALHYWGIKGKVSVNIEADYVDLKKFSDFEEKLSCSENPHRVSIPVK